MVLKTVLNIISLIIALLSGIIFGWHGIIAIAGYIKIIKNRKHTPEKPCTPDTAFDIIICAHNEETCIANLLDSLKAQTYPQKLLKVFLVADNCTDRTADIASEYGFVNILERHTEGASTKGKALSWAIDLIRENHLSDSGYLMIFDADNVIAPDFIEKLSVHFKSGAKIVTGNRVSTNPYRTIVSSWYSIYWSMVMNIFCRPHRQMNLSATLSGTGFGFAKEILENGRYTCGTMTEDIEFTMMQNLKLIPADYAHNAYFYDEQPLDLKTMFPQLARWTTGGHQILRRFWKRFMTGIRSQKETKDRIFVLDALMSLLMGPGLAIGFVGSLIINLITVILYGLNITMVASGGLLFFAGSIIVGLFSAKCSNYKVGKMILPVILYPVFTFSMSLISFWSMIFPQKKWKKINHTGLQ